jgi:uncharacterized membrane protein YhhN
VDTAVAFTLACLAAAAGLVVAEWRRWRAGRVVTKLAASVSFVLVALALDAPSSAYGRWILAALVLGLAGDALLLGAHSAAFLGGLGAFLASHVCFAVAFVVVPFSAPAFAVALVPAAALGFVIVRWLWPHLGPGFKPPVLAYVAAILLMCCCAAGASAAAGRWWVLGGAVLFAASDISVARDRFVADQLVNRVWGLPAYFVAQLVLAWSVASPA